MSQSVIDIILRSKKEGKGEQEAVSGLKKLSDTFKDLTGVSLGAAGTIAAVGAGLRFSVGQAIEAEKTQAQLSAALRSTGEAAGLSVNELNAMADELSSMSSVQDDTITKAQALMLTFTQVKDETFPGAMEAALNMSAALGQDLSSSVIQLGKALNDPVKGVSALREVGVSLTEAQQEQVKAFMAVNDVAGAQQVILSELNTEFGGMAEAMGSTTEGKVNKLKNAMGDLGEVIGSQITPLLAAAAENTAEFINNIVELNNLVPDEIGRIKEEASSYEQLKSRVEDFAAEHNYLIDQYGNLTIAGGRVVEFNALMSESEWEVSRSLTESDNRLRMLAEATGVAEEATVDYTSVLGDVSSVMGEVTEQMIFQAASAGLDADAALQLAKQMGLVDGNSLYLRDELRELTAEFDLNHDGIVDNTEATAEYMTKISDLGETAANLKDKTIYVDVVVQGTYTERLQAEAEAYAASAARAAAAGATGKKLKANPTNPNNRADGGPVFPNKTYLVGEEGPEVLRMGPSGAGYVVPNDQIGQATGLTIIHNGDINTGEDEELFYYRIKTRMQSEGLI